MGADVPAAQTVDEPRLQHHVERLPVGAAEHHRAAGGLHALDDALEGVEGGGIHGRHQLHAQDEHTGQGGDPLEGVLHLLRGAEEKRAEDAEDDDALGDVLAADDLLGGLQLVAGSDLGDLGGFGHALDEEHGGEHHADLDGDDEVEDHREGAGGEKHGGVAVRHAAQAGEFVPLAHAEGDHDEHGRDGAERYVAGEGREEEHDQEQRERVDQAGDGGAAAGLDVGRGAGDGARHGQPAEKRAYKVCRALRHEFGVGVVPVVDEAVGDDGGKQRLDGAEEGDGHGRAEEVANAVERDLGPDEGRQGVGDGIGAETGADRRHARGFFPTEPGDEDRGDDQGDDGAGHAPRVQAVTVAGPEVNEQGRGRRDEQRWEIEVRQVGGQPGQLFDELARRGFGGGNAQELGGLARHEGHGNARGEAAGDRVGDVLDQAAQPGEAHEDEDHAGHEACQQQPVKTVLLDDQEDDGDEGGGRSRDLHAAAAQGGGDETADDGGENADGGSREGRRDARGNAGHAEREGQRQGDEADGHAGEQVRDELRPAVALAEQGEQARAEPRRRQGQIVRDAGQFHGGGGDAD